MNDVKFKVGDLVYCPNLTAGIVTLRHTLAYQESRKKLDSIPFYVFEFSYLPFGCANGGFLYYVNENGCHDTHQKPIIFHATQENYELLSKLYPNVSFEPPPKRKEPKEIIKAMLDSGYHGVPCKTECGRDKYICTGIVEGEFYPFQYDNDEDNAYGSGIPYHPKTGLKIVDFIDGKCVLENGEVVE